MAIVSIRGTSGSGKSTVVREVMKKYNCEPINAPWRRRPLGYLCYADEHKPLFIPGHYETDCGGCDTLPAIEFTFNLIRRYINECDVIYEGLITQSDVNRCIQLHKDGYSVLVIGLNLPLAKCLKYVQQRRDARAEAHGRETSPLNPSNTNAKHHQITLQEAKFKSAKMDFRWLCREDALRATLEFLGWKNQPDSFDLSSLPEAKDDGSH